MIRAYSFCAVFLFRFINRNRNRRVQKERLSFERNNFHGKKWHIAIVWFQTEKEKSTKTLYENEIRKKNTGDFLDRLLVFADPVIFFVLSRQSSNVYSWLPAGNGELLLCWQPSFSKGKAVKKMRNKTRNSLLCFLTKLRRYFDEGECGEDCFPGCSRRQGKKRNCRCSSIKKKDPDPLACGCIADQFSTSCRVPACGKPT